MCRAGHEGLSDMRQINLLPHELKPDKKLGIAVKKVQKYLIAVIIMYIIAISGYFISLEYLKGNKEKRDTQKTMLSSQIKSLTAVETSAVAIRDRAQKYSKLQNRNIEKTGLLYFEDIYKFLPASTFVDGVRIAENELSFNASVSDTVSLLYIFDAFSEYSEFKKITISEISYNPEGGYSFFVSAVY